MNTNALLIAACALAAGSALAEPSHHTNVQFGNETVEVKFSNVGDPRLIELWDQTADATDPAEAERLWRIRWEEYGEAIALQSLAGYHLDRGDLVSGYAHLYATNKLAKWYQATVTKDFKPAPSQRGTYQPPGPVMKKLFAEIEADMKLVEQELTPRQRDEGVKLAAALVRNNPNCCTW
jgi:hypothetical protein